MNLNYSRSFLAEQLALMGRSWRWILVTGIAYVLLGLVLLSWPVASTVAVTVMIGATLLAGGVLQSLHAIQLRHYPGNDWRIVQAVAALLAGGLILRFPAGGMLAVGVALAFFLFIAGISKLILALGIRPIRGWGWMLLSALASLVLAVFIVATLPASSLWIPGAILGIELIFTGISLIGFSFHLRRLFKDSQEYVQHHLPNRSISAR